MKYSKNKRKEDWMLKKKIHLKKKNSHVALLEEDKEETIACNSIFL